jgi:hypothetical protein
VPRAREGHFANGFLDLPALPDSTNPRNLQITSSSKSNYNLSAAAIYCFATSLKLAVTGCDAS